MHDERRQIEARIRRMVRDRIRPAIHGRVAPVEVTAWVVDGEPVPVADARAATFDPFAVGQRWGRPWGTTWFRLTGTVPSGWADETVELIVDFATGVGAGFQAEGLLYRFADGGPIRGIHPFHQAVPIGLVADADGSFDVLVEAAANPVIAVSQRPTPLGDPATAGDALQYRLNRAELAVRHDDVWHLDLDLQVLTGLLREIVDGDPRGPEIRLAIDRALDRFDPHDAAGSAAGVRAALEPVLARRAADHAHRVSAIGHAHIDTAWLWPLRETRRKCARTFSSAVTLMDAYPEYRFACSQAAQYDWIAVDQPELFERISAKVADGRFVPVGSMWVEADANLPSGESLARQFVWGKRYFAETFGIDTREVWIPDVFGYAGNLPQIMALAGCDHFLTQKLSWNQTNAFPHNTFRWEGIDGTRILTHFPPADTYNGEVVASELIGGVRRFRDQGPASRSMYLFGHGDGGGGPTREMLERARRVADLDGYPRLAMETPATFFAAAEAEYPDAPVWRGELYFEMHRGTFTSQAATKAGNRRGELALRELELWTALDRGDTSAADLERLWKVLLLHQFHDIIPGSSIAWVHDDTEAAHAELLAEVEARIVAALTRPPTPTPTPKSQGPDLGNRGESTAIWGVGNGADGDGAVGDVVGANAGPFDFAGVVADPPVWVDAPAHGAGPVAHELPAGVESVTIGRAPGGDESSRGVHILDNGLVQVVIDEDGTIDSFFDHGADRECLAGPGNVLQCFADHPNTYDAWDIEAHTLAVEPEVLTAVDSIALIDDGPFRAGIEIVRTFGSSTITQTYVLHAGSPRLDIVTGIDWREDEKLLKAAFPFDLRADDARYDVQYGHVRRPTHRNTSWDQARFEVCGHFWADVAEPDFGVAVVNDAKYGHDCIGDAHSTTMRLSLLRAPNYPDPDADRGQHHFTYGLVPHGASLEPVLREAWALNLPPRLVVGAPAASLVRVDHPGVVVTAVKAADDDSGDLVVRVHEAFGGRARAAMTFGVEVFGAHVADLAEVAGDAIDVVDGAVALDLRPFQILTIRLRRA